MNYAIVQARRHQVKRREIGVMIGLDPRFGQTVTIKEIAAGDIQAKSGTLSTS